MSTFLQMQDNIEGYLLRTDLNTYVKLAINRAIKKYSKAKIWFDETTANFNTSQGQWVYTILDIPGDIRQIDHMRIQVNNVYYTVIQRPAQYIIEANVNSNQGQPIDWAWYDQAIYFYPIPQDTYPITLFYQKEYTPLVFPTDTNDWTIIPEAEELIECEALRWLYKKVILDKDKAEEYKEDARIALQVLNQINESMTGSLGDIQPTYW